MSKEKYDVLKEFAHAYFWRRSDKYNWTDYANKKLLEELKKKYFI